MSAGIDIIRVILPRPQIVRLDNVTVTGSSGGGSFLSVNIARVDASGNDGTGTIGDLTKPFLTVQAAIDAILAQESFDSSAFYCIDIGANQFTEDLTINDSISLIFRGASSTSMGPAGGNIFTLVCNSLTLTASAAICAKDCTFSNSEIATSDDLDLILDNVDLNGRGVTSTAGSGKHLIVISPTNSGYNAGVFQADDITEIDIIGILAKSGGADIVVANSSPNILIKNCSPPSTNDGDVTVNDVICGGDPSVTVINSILRNITLGAGASSVTLINSIAIADITAFQVTLTNSKVLGTITGTASIDSAGVGVGISFPDADPLIAGAPYWDGATLKKSAGP